MIPTHPNNDPLLTATGPRYDQCMQAWRDTAATVLPAGLAADVQQLIDIVRQEHDLLVGLGDVTDKDQIMAALNAFDWNGADEVARRIARRAFTEAMPTKPPLGRLIRLHDTAYLWALTLRDLLVDQRDSATASWAAVLGTDTEDLDAPDPHTWTPGPVPVPALPAPTPTVDADTELLTDALAKVMAYGRVHDIERAVDSGVSDAEYITLRDECWAAVNALPSDIAARVHVTPRPVNTRGRDGQTVGSGR